MLNLIANENMKIYRRFRTWMLVAILILAAAGVTALLKVEMIIQDDWKAALGQEIGSLEEQINSPDVPQIGKEDLERSLTIKRYALEQEINPYSMWEPVMNLSGLLQIVTIFVVIIVGDMVAGEYSWGTIKMLLTRPVSRTKILLSKYLSAILFALFLMSVLFISAIVISGISIGFENVDVPHLFIGEDGAVREGKMLVSVFITYALRAVELFMVVTIAFTISTVFKSSSLAIAFSIFTTFAGQMIADLLLNKFNWGKFFLFANTDLIGLVQGVPRFEGMTLPFSITVLAIYFVIFNLISWLIFNKRDVVA